MSVLIKGVEMPKNCNECPLHFYEGQGICCCRALPAIDDDEILKPWKNKRKDCPLVPVPPHGRLIDADALLDFILNVYKTAQGDARKAYRDVLDTIVAAGDIIQAEEGE